MGRELHDESPAAREVFAEADDALGFALSALVFSGSESDLALTENTQPAVLTVSVAALRLLERSGVRASTVAGHSLGEYSALVAAGAMRFRDAVILVRKRGRYMQEAVPVGAGAMAALIGMEPGVVEEVCAEASRGDVVVGANYNAPDQTVIAGEAGAVRRAVALAEARGVKRALMLSVSAPFHCPLMEPAAVRLAADLDATEFHDLAVDLVTNVDAEVVRTAAAARAALKRQVTAPVRWTESVRKLRETGVATVVEVGPGRVLGGLVRRIDRSLEVLNVEDTKSLERTLAALGEPA
jgi:[acyl-carrier-protein] S-malonyltransferase